MTALPEGAHLGAVILVTAVARALATVELEQVIQAGHRALSVGPLLHPTEFQRKSVQLEQDLELLAAARPLWRWARGVAERQVAGGAT
jgi:hypothetical protein